MFFTIFFALTMTILGAVVVKTARIRSITRRTGGGPAVERDVLSSILSNPRRFAYVAPDLEPDFFTVKQYQQIWLELLEYAPTYTYFEMWDKNPLKAAHLAAKDIEDDPEWVEGFKNKTTLPKEVDVLLSQNMWPGEKNDKKVMGALSLLKEGYDNRGVYSGLFDIEVVDVDASQVGSWEGESNLVRKEVRLTNREYYLGALFGALSAAASLVGLNLSGFTGPALVVGALTFMVFFTGYMHVAWVDWYTMYLDIPVWAVTLALSYAGALISNLGVLNATDSVFVDPIRLVMAGVATVVVVVMFEVLNLVYTRLRNKPGQGFGDTLIVLGTLFVPVALTGQLIVAYWSILAAGILALLFALGRKAVTKENHQAPLAFGPWLVLGVPVAILLASTGWMS